MLLRAFHSKQKKNHWRKVMIHNSVAATLMVRVECLIRANKKPFVAHNRGINFFFFSACQREQKIKLSCQKITHIHRFIPHFTTSSSLAECLNLSRGFFGAKNSLFFINWWSASLLIFINTKKGVSWSWWSQ